MKTKTVKEWLETLPPTLRKSALRQANLYYLNVNTTSLSNAIHLFQNWFYTEEEQDFWHSFYLALQWAETEDNKTI